MKADKPSGSLVESSGGTRTASGVPGWMFAAALLLVAGIPAGVCGGGTSALEAANQLHAAGRLSEAEVAFREILWSETNESVVAKAMFNLGMTIKAEGRWDDAIRAFLVLRDTKVNDREPGSHLMEPYRNYRPRAQWEIGNCHFLAGRYAEAREAYGLTRKSYPFQSGCGNERWAHSHRVAFMEGLCGEYLGKPREAVKSYYEAAFGSGMMGASPQVHLRLLALYDSCGQTNDLAHLLTEVDRWFMTRMEWDAKHPLSDQQRRRCEEMSPTRFIRRMWELRSMADTGNDAGLIDCLKTRGSVLGPPHDGNPEAEEASRLLSLHPARSSRALLAVLNATNCPNWSWTMYALGRCGTAEGVEWLLNEARKQENCHAAASCVHALAQAGEAGKRALDELAAIPNFPGKYALDRAKRQSTGVPEVGTVFPVLPKAKLPSRLEELDDDFAYLQSLPKSVAVDVSTPEGCLSGYLTCLMIHDTNAVDQFTGGDPRWHLPAERRPGGRLSRISFVVGKAEYRSDAEAEVGCELTKDGRTDRATLLLIRTNGVWRIAKAISESRR